MRPPLIHDRRLELVREDLLDRDDRKGAVEPSFNLSRVGARHDPTAHGGGHNEARVEVPEARIEVLEHYLGRILGASLSVRLRPRFGAALSEETVEEGILNEEDESSG
jgi:hypothetical protein